MSSERRAAVGGALLVGVLAAAVAALKFWLYGALLLLGALLAAWLVSRRPAALERLAARLPRPLRAGTGLGAATAAVAVALAAVVLVAPVYVVRDRQGDETRARNWVRDADHELDSRDFETARLYLQRAIEADPDVEGVDEVRARMARLERE